MCGCSLVFRTVTLQWRCTRAPRKRWMQRCDSLCNCYVSAFLFKHLQIFTTSSIEPLLFSYNITGQFRLDSPIPVYTIVYVLLKKWLVIIMLNRWNLTTQQLNSKTIRAPRSWYNQKLPYIKCLVNRINWVTVVFDVTLIMGVVTAAASRPGKVFGSRGWNAAATAWHCWRGGAHHCCSSVPR